MISFLKCLFDAARIEAMQVSWDATKLFLNLEAKIQFIEISHFELIH